MCSVCWRSDFGILYGEQKLINKVNLASFKCYFELIWIVWCGHQFNQAGGVCEKVETEAGPSLKHITEKHGMRGVWLLLTRLFVTACGCLWLPVAAVSAVTPEHKNLINIHLTPDPRWLRGATATSYWGHYNCYTGYNGTVVSRAVNQVRVVSQCPKKAPSRALLFWKCLKNHILIGHLNTV